MRVSVLGSGSSGNAVLVWAGETRLLVDAGFSARELARRLASVGVAATEIDAVVITHDHTDHTRGMGVFARRHGTPLYLTEPTRAAAARFLRGRERIVPYRAGHAFTIGAIRVEPFVTAHDAVDPVGVAVVDERSGARLGVATDLGRPTAHARYALAGCDVLILEANHDDTLLVNGSYPWAVKGRIASSHGHLSNHAAARFAGELVHPRLAAVILAHLSEDCNRPELALDAVGRALAEAGWSGHLSVASQHAPTPLVDVETLRRGCGLDRPRSR